MSHERLSENYRDIRPGISILPEFFHELVTEKSGLMHREKYGLNNLNLEITEDNVHLFDFNNKSGLWLLKYSHSDAIVSQISMFIETKENSLAQNKPYLLRQFTLFDIDGNFFNNLSIERLEEQSSGIRHTAIFTQTHNEYIETLEIPIPKIYNFSTQPTN